MASAASSGGPLPFHLQCVSPNRANADSTPNFTSSRQSNNLLRSSCERNRTQHSVALRIRETQVDEQKFFTSMDAVATLGSGTALDLTASTMARSSFFKR